MVSNIMNQYQLLIVLAFFLIEGALMGYLIATLKKRVDILYGKTEPHEQHSLNENVVARLTNIEQQLGAAEPRMQLLETVAAMSVQKIGFVRFNPFQDTGGDNSFAIALLDYHNNGIVVSSLYTRDGVRVYAKHIERGQSRHQLSREEIHVLKEAMKQQFV